MLDPNASSTSVIAAYAPDRSIPWANGGGSTVELVSAERSRDLTPGHRGWRLSIARLERPAPFSSFPGLRRMFMPVGGQVELDVDGVPREVPEGRVLVFDGSAPTRLTGLSAPCHAVNLMVPEACDDVRLLPPSEVDGARGYRLLLTLEGSEDFGAFTLLAPRDDVVHEAHEAWGALAAIEIPAAPSARA